MAYFDRFDICEAHCVLEWDYNIDGWLIERPANRRRRESTGCQLSRMHFKPKPSLSYDTLTDNGKEIYNNLCAKYNLPF